MPFFALVPPADEGQFLISERTNERQNSHKRQSSTEMLLEMRADLRQVDQHLHADPLQLPTGTDTRHLEDLLASTDQQACGPANSCFTRT